jgi:large subunit ribosomal protein L23
MKNKERLYKILLSPVVSEKANALGSDARQLCFKVTSCATKLEIKQAVELVFGAKVASVRVLNQLGAQRNCRATFFCA